MCIFKNVNSYYNFQRLKKINNLTSFILYQCNDCYDIKTLEDTYQSLSEVSGQPSFQLNRKRTASNKKSETQRHFYSTRKKRKLSGQSLRKPSISDVEFSQTVLNKTETYICAICFSENDKDSSDLIDWISCNSCYIWVHTECANTNNDSDYICQYCLMESS